MFAYGVFYLLRRFGNKKNINVVTTTLVTLMFIYFMLPAFKGNLVSKSMRVGIPDRYFEMFSYFNNQNDFGRVADFPVHSFWGWSYHDWQDHKLGYQGAGFLWFGIKQPLLNREFDRWGSFNEQYYKEMSFAVYSQNVDVFEKLLSKYQIKWILLDKSLFSPTLDQKGLYIEELEEMLFTSSVTKLEKDFGEGLLVYKVNNDYKRQEVVSDFVYAGPQVYKEAVDPIYNKFGNYVVSDATHSFVGITNVDESLDTSIVSSDKTHTFLIPKNGEVDVYPYEIRLVTGDEGRFVEIWGGDGRVVFAHLLNSNRDYLLEINNVIVPVVDGLLYSGIVGAEENILFSLYSGRDLFTKPTYDFSTLVPCELEGENAAYEIAPAEFGFKLSARNTRACALLPLSTVLLNKGVGVGDTLRVGVEYSGVGGSACVIDKRTGGCVGLLARSGESITMLAEILQDLENYFVRYMVNSTGEKVEVTFSSTDITLLNKPEEFEVDTYGLLTSQEKLKFEKMLVLDEITLPTSSSPFMCSSGYRELGDSDVFYENGVRYTSNKTAVCDRFKIPNINRETGYVVEIGSRNIKGIPLRMCVKDNLTGKCDLYVSLPQNSDLGKSYYMVPPVGEGAYSIEFSNISFDENETINEINHISITPISYHKIKDAHSNVETSKDSRLLVFSEAYDNGWVAMCGKKLCNYKHVLVNSWANGWVVDGEMLEDVRIMFWPQYLQYLGFFLVLTVFIYLLRKKKPQNL